LCGAQISYISQDQWSGHERFAQELQLSYRNSGDNAFFIPIGASDEIGLWGYIAAAQELKRDFDDMGIKPDYIVCATGSGGTQGGLLVGARLFEIAAKCVAFNVSDDAQYFHDKIVADVTLWKQRYNLEFDVASLPIKTIEGYLGPGYGVAGEEVFAAINALAKSDGIFLDPVYTGKAFHGMVSEIKKGDLGELAGAKNVVFIHTGGLFGVFPQGGNFAFK
jgi:D-cysteine desulfhydrase